MGRRLVSVLNLRHLLAYCRNVILHAGGSPEHPGLISGGNGVEVCKLMLIWRPIGSGQSLNYLSNHFGAEVRGRRRQPVVAAAAAAAACGGLRHIDGSSAGERWGG